MSGEQTCLLSLRNTLGIVGMVLGCTVFMGSTVAIVASVGYLIAPRAWRRRLPPR